MIAGSEKVCKNSEELEMVKFLHIPTNNFVKHREKIIGIEILRTSFSCDF